MNVADAEFDGRTIRCLRKPEIKILTMFPALEEENVVARVQVSQSIQGGVVIVRGFRVELRVFIGVRQERVKICEKMTVP